MDISIPNRAPLIKLNNGVTMPALGLGMLNRTAPELTTGAVEAAISSGYRLIDTAASYNSERGVGEGIARSGVDRSELFITTKLWMTDYGYDSALRGFDKSLRKLGLGYLDLYLLHWPVPGNFGATVQSYRAATKLFEEGRVRAIGVSNFGTSHLKALIDQTGIVPAVNQVELHPLFNQLDLRRENARLGIATESWSPLGGSRARGAGSDATRDPLEHPTVRALAAKHRKTPAQVVLRWHIDHGLVAIPKSVRRERIAENIDIFDFALTAEEVAAIDEMDTGVRSGPDPETVHSKSFPITIED
jgi:diketogulonate reductase-like aldo/keto reductase